MEVYSGEVDITKLEKGDIIYEIIYGFAVKTIVKIRPHKNDEGVWKWICLDSQGKEVEYMVAEKYSHYGPKLYHTVPYTGLTVV